MIGTLKNFVLRILTRLGYQVIKVPRGNSIYANQAQQKHDLPAREDLLASLPGIVRGLQPEGQPRLDGYQLEMATYDLKTVMGDVEPEFFPYLERCGPYTMVS